MQRNIFAHTAPGPLPEYLSVNERNGNVVVTARGADGGATVDVVLPRERVDELGRALSDYTGREAQIKHMVARFLAWKLPEHFNPDGGISFKREFNEHTAHPMRNEPSGTNLFDATQADAMVRHMLEGLSTG